MPILPPRNLPLSPPTQGGGSGDKGKKEGSSSSTASPSGRNPSTPSKVRSVSGQALSPSQAKQSSSPLSSVASQLERHDETTFHRRLRSLLYDHRTAREAWEDLVSLDGAKSIATVSQLATQLEENVRKIAKGMPESYATLPTLLQITQNQYESNAMDEMAKLAQALTDERETLSGIFVRLGKASAKMEAISDAANTLLVECTRTKGDQFAFEREAWTTWPIVRFVDVLQALTSRYVVQTEHLSTLRDIMLNEGCRSSQSNDESRESNEGLDEEDSDQEGDDEKHSRKKTALIRQRILEEWQALPYLSDDAQGRDSQWFEDICEAEVGRWNE